jgi:hypothetical protein
MTTPAEPALWISESEVVSMMDIGGAIGALERGLLAEAQGNAQNMIKTHVEWDGATLHAIGDGNLRYQDVVSYQGRSYTAARSL